MLTDLSTQSLRRIITASEKHGVRSKKPSMVESNIETIKVGKSVGGLHLASLAILMEVSWMPNPIREAFLLNSDLEETGNGDFDEVGAFSD